MGTGRPYAATWEILLTIGYNAKLEQCMKSKQPTTQVLQLGKCFPDGLKQIRKLRSAGNGLWSPSAPSRFTPQYQAVAATHILFSPSNEKIGRDPVGLLGFYLIRVHFRIQRETESREAVRVEKLYAGVSSGVTFTPNRAVLEG